MAASSIDPDVRFRLLRLLEAHPELSQRQIASELGVSLGATNYCLKALIEKGLLKVKNFTASGNKRAYAYILTGKGLSEKTSLAAGFLMRKRAEYDALKAEIERLEEEFVFEEEPRARA